MSIYHLLLFPTIFSAISKKTFIIFVTINISSDKFHKMLSKWEYLQSIW